jgi:hypothetical protein
MLQTNGQPDWVFMVNELALNPITKDEYFRIPEEIRKYFRNALIPSGFAFSLSGD